MDSVVHGCDGGLGEVVMSELHCVGDLCRAGGFCHNCVASLVFQRYTNIPARCTAEVPIMSCPYLFVCDYVTPEGSDGCSITIERSVEV